MGAGLSPLVLVPSAVTAKEPDTPVPVPVVPVAESETGNGVTTGLPLMVGMIGWNTTSA